MFINIVEIKSPDVDAQLVANSNRRTIRKSCFFPSCQKLAIQRAMKCGAKGIKTQVFQVV